MTYTDYLKQDHTEQSVKSYLHVLNHFKFHSKDADRSSYEDILNYLTNQNMRNGRVLAGLKKYFDYLVETGARDHHPCKHLIISRTPKPIQFQELFTSEELELLLNRKSRYKDLATRNKVILSLLIYQALTPANIQNLRVKDIDLENGTIYVKATKTISRRTLELKSKQIILLQAYLNNDRDKLQKIPTDSLFIAKLGNPISTEGVGSIVEPLKSLFPRRNINAKIIRKSVIANWLNEDKIPVEDVQLLSGQKWLSTTEIYLKQDMEKEREMINEFWAM